MVMEKKPTPPLAEISAGTPQTEPMITDGTGLLHAEKASAAASSKNGLAPNSSGSSLGVLCSSQSSKRSTESTT